MKTISQRGRTKYAFVENRVVEVIIFTVLTGPLVVSPSKSIWLIL